MKIMGDDGRESQVGRWINNKFDIKWESLEFRIFSRQDDSFGFSVILRSHPKSTFFPRLLVIQSNSVIQ